MLIAAAAATIIALAYFTYCRERYDAMDDRIIVAALIMCWTNGVLVGIMIGSNW